MIQQQILPIIVKVPRRSEDYEASLELIEQPWATVGTMVEDSLDKVGRSGTTQYLERIYEVVT